MRRSHGFRAEDLPEHIRRLNAGVLRGVSPAPVVQEGQGRKSPQSERRRALRVDKLNKTEARFLAELRRSMAGQRSAMPELDALEIWCYDIQPPRFFEFEDGDTYTPDFLLLAGGRGQVVAEIKKFFPDKVYRATIPRNVRLSEAPSFGEPVIYYDKGSVGAHAYAEFTREFLKANRPKK